MFQANFVEKNKSHILFQQHFYKDRPSMRQFGKSFVQPDEAQMIIQKGACA